ncbi:MAG: hypothetical protein AAGG48_05950 [Planctomycetota bacterium]
MLKKMLLAAVLLAAPMVMTQTASADYCYRGYRAPVVSYRAPIARHPGIYGSSLYRSSLYRSSLSPYGVPYRSRYVSPYGVYGGYPYYGRGSVYGVNRGGVGLYIGF